MTLKWFRIVTSSKGEIVSCNEVEAKGKQRLATIRYYCAESEVDARSSAEEWWVRTRAEARASAAARRAARRAEGLCVKCGARRGAGRGLLCTACSDRTRANQRELYAGRAPKVTRHESAESALYANRAKVAKSIAKSHAETGCASARRYLTLLARIDRMTHAQLRADTVARFHRVGGKPEALAEYERKRAETLDKKTGDAYKRAAKVRHRATKGT